MKLKTRIVLVSCSMVVAVSLITNFISWYFMEKSLESEMINRAYGNAVDSFKQYDEVFGKSEDDKEEYIRYYLRNSGNEYVACIKWEDNIEYNSIKDTEVYNHTIFTAEQLKNMCRGEGYKLREYKGLSYINIEYGNRKYMVFTQENESYYIVQFEDITFHDKIWEFRLLTISATGVLVIIMVLFLGKMLGKELHPLQELSDNTRKIVKGVYSERIKTGRKDEIGQLGENFNKMAEAVEMNISNLKESERNKTIFMGNLTHELKTPLTAISGYAQTLLNVKLSEDDEKEALTYIYEECGRLERLSGKMIRLLELDESKDLDLCDIRVDEIFGRAVKSCRYMAEEKNISIDIINEEEVNGKIKGDIDLMTDVVINLIDNGIKASSSGGRITLRYKNNIIEVQDYGMGIPKEELDKIMEPFYMVDKSRSRKKGGAGLGLSLVSLIVRKHNMMLEIESEEGKGTLVRIHTS